MFYSCVIYTGNRTRLSDVDRSEIRKKYKQMLDEICGGGGGEQADGGIDEQAINDALNKVGLRSSIYRNADLLKKRSLIVFKLEIL